MYVCMLMSIISFLCPSLAAAHRVEVILVPCSIDVGYFYDIIFPSCFDTYQGLTSTVSRGLSKNQGQSSYSWKNVGGSRCDLSQRDLPPSIILGITALLHPTSPFIER